MTSVFHRHTHNELPTAVRGEGVWLFDNEGKRYLDASGGAAVSCLGHSDASVREAMKAQIDRLAFAHSGFFTTEPMEALAARLVARAPGRLRDGKVYFVSGGSEAVETALKMARQYFVETGQPQRKHVIARRQSYHGNTLGALAAGGNQWRRAPFEPLLIEASHVSPCYPYRGKIDGESDEAYADRLAEELEQEIAAQGPETVMAFVAETVVGATAGVLPPVEGYFRRVREICDRHGILLILDEVMCGMGRTGTLFACEQDGIAPDMLATAKGLGAGYQPIGALLCSDAIWRAFRDGSGFFQHGHTYMGHALACAAAIAVQERIEDGDLLSNVNRRGEELRNALESRFGNHPHVGDIRGRGLFIGIEMVADRLSKEPFDPAYRLNARIKSEAMTRGLMCYPMGGTVDGKRGDHVMLAPPFIIDADMIEVIVDRLGAAIDAATAQSAV
ncbi:aspartate aminotransferase family protein [Fodinicurvata sp. EGI_FJ10296]|uniref:aspartate aminotransferase family protein n=1 Tax=Fodinicurvata sp. EGI_FJ10296 TaxID=3231908 RepID=UPI0034528E05